MQRTRGKNVGFTSLALLAALGALIWPGRSGTAAAPAVQAAQTQSAGGPVLMPLLPRGARELLPLPGKLVVYNPGPGAGVLRLERLEVLGPYGLLDALELSQALPGDPSYGEIQALIERLPRELTEQQRERHYFAPAGASQFAGSEVVARMNEVQEKVEAYRQKYAAGRPQPYAEIDFWLPADLVFAPGDAPGEQRSVSLMLHWRDASGTAHLASTTSAIERLAPWPRVPASLAKSIPGTSVHAGDLHVHSCHGEATGACAPSGNCTAETLQVSGSFSFAQLKSGFQAIGVDWFSSTEHSYCINSDSEYDTIKAELAAISDAAFLAYADTELSCDEEGSQEGSDVGDLACIFGTPSNHMGAHGITARKAGGSDGFLGFCNGLFSDVLPTFSSAAAAVRAEGGYPIVNHPVSGSAWAWNSIQATHGIESNQMHGVEIWNGGSSSGQGGHVSTWVNWLLLGRLLYCYSGSDTHDDVFGFGACQAVLYGQPFNAGTIKAAVKAGHVYLSNGPLLILESALNGGIIPMGTLQGLSPAQPGVSIPLRTHYNFGANNGSITLYKGRVGDAAESVLCSSGSLSGEGVFECLDTLNTTSRTWYRAYAEAAGGAQVAYTNPIFFLPGSCSHVSYGVGLGGANVATLSSLSAPNVGSVNTFAIGGLAGSGSSVAFLAASGVKIAAGLPIAGGFLLIGLPPLLQVVVPIPGGAGTFTVQVPDDASLVGAKLYWQAGTIHAGLPGGLAFSNGLETTFCALLQ